RVCCLRAIVGSYLLCRLFLLVSDCLTRALTGTCVVLRVLTAYRKATAVADSTVAADFHQTLDVEVRFTAKVPFNFQAVDLFTVLVELCVSVIAYARLFRTACTGEDLLGSRLTGSGNVSECDDYALFARYVYTSNTCHIIRAPPWGLTLAL